MSHGAVGIGKSAGTAYASAMTRFGFPGLEGWLGVRFAIPALALACLFFSVMVPSASLAAPPHVPPWKWRTGAVGVILGSEYFVSQANYEDGRGSFRRLTGDNSVSTFENRLVGLYGLSTSWYLFGGASLHRTRVVDQTIEKASLNVGDLTLGFYAMAWERWLRVIPELSLNIPGKRVSALQTEPLIGHGQISVRAVAHLFKPTRRYRLNVFGHLGIDAPLGSLSKRLVYEAAIERPFGTNFAAGAAIGGFETIVSDSTSASERGLTSQSAMGGSAHYLAYNPARLETRVWVGFSPQRVLRLRLGYLKTLDGIRSAEGQSFFLQVNYNHDSGTRAPAPAGARPSGDPSVRAQQNLRDFRVNPESTDPDLFDSDDQFAPTPKSTDPLDETQRLLNDQRSR
jgi:hypothetical protein